ncbi:hypothetical protein phytr_10870 [Candidatus Phycorickettsia trachydisci]|uniref:Uncharacterized protein n=1 Tax=Candidatus Phycorickettsia trachydisci TaxID=2115978 RepID=A0A2P1P9Q4_9RICK|nr:hypothetical protein [Candidatus Phycorickettsia trachydisci]AVP88014.1 hypothetical protein phytr_10870 [Candidatus Phycorickettsia trachydisci]
MNNNNIIELGGAAVRSEISQNLMPVASEIVMPTLTASEDPVLKALIAIVTAPSVTGAVIGGAFGGMIGVITTQVMGYLVTSTVSGIKNLTVNALSGVKNLIHFQTFSNKDIDVVNCEDTLTKSMDYSNSISNPEDTTEVGISADSIDYMA